MVLKRNIASFYHGIISLLLSACIVSNISFNTIHVSFSEHHHPATNCSTDEENDACHRFLVHHEKSDLCDGSHTHVHSKADECFFCKYLNAHQKSFSLSESVSFHQETTPFVFPLETFLLFHSDHLFDFTRGPPLS